MGDPDGTVIPVPFRVIPAKAGIQKKNIMALALATGLLVLLGAGCSQSPQTAPSASATPTTLQASSSDSVLNVQGLELDKDGLNAHIVGLDRICSLQNAKIFFAGDVPWGDVQSELDAKIVDGWKIEKFCYQRVEGGYFVMHKPDKPDVADTEYMIGAVVPWSGKNVTFSKPFQLPESGSVIGWDVQAVYTMGEPMGSNVIVAKALGENLLYGWTASVTFNPLNEELSTTDVCSTGLIKGGSPVKNIKLPKSCIK